MSNDFLRFGVQEVERTPADLGEVIEEVVDFFNPTARAANIEIKCYLPGDLPPVALDADLFKQLRKPAAERPAGHARRRRDHVAGRP